MRENITPKKKIFTRKLRKESTPQEIILWSKLKGRRFKNLKFRRQHLIGNYVVDFVCIENKLIIELDGWQHGEIEQGKYDKSRTKFLESLGFRVVRFWNGEINNNLEGVLLTLEELI